MMIFMCETYKLVEFKNSRSSNLLYMSKIKNLNNLKMNQRMLLFLLCFLIFCIRPSNEAISCFLCVGVCAAGISLRASTLLEYCNICIANCPGI